jgi:hypothetical protein
MVELWITLCWIPEHAVFFNMTLYVRVGNTAIVCGVCRQSGEGGGTRRLREREVGKSGGERGFPILHLTQNSGISAENLCREVFY